MFCELPFLRKYITNKAIANIQVVATLQELSQDIMGGKVHTQNL